MTHCQIGSGLLNVRYIKESCMAVTKATIIEFSPTGTTREVLQDIAAGFATLPVNTVKFTHPAFREGRELKYGPEDLLIVGMPVYGGRLPRIADEVLGHLAGDNTPVALVVSYGNRHYDDALLEMKNILSARGFIPIAAGAFVGQHSLVRKVASGRPDKTDKDAARDFGANLEKKALSGAFGVVEVPGAFPYSKEPVNAPFGPTVSPLCTGCAACRNACGFDAIAFGQYTKTDLSKCCLCMACVKVCPAEARTVQDERFDGLCKMVEASAQDRREAEVFI